MEKLQRTVLYDRHKALGARMVEFGGWEMPIEYPGGVVAEHLGVRSGAGLFDVSHMGRFVIRGEGALRFVQHVLSNNAQALDLSPVAAQYTLIPDETGGAIDDAFLYRFVDGEYLLVVNAANRKKDWDHLAVHAAAFEGVELLDITYDMAMFALQGPKSRAIIEAVAQDPAGLPEPYRNAVGIAFLAGVKVMISRTGYTGEPLGFELFTDREHALKLWDSLMEKGAVASGLGARDTLRLESSLPLYGHEFGIDRHGRKIPCFAFPIARWAVSFSPLKGDFVGRTPLQRQFAALSKIICRDYSLICDLPRMFLCVAVTGRGIARAGAQVFKDGKAVGYVSSGTMVPYRQFEDKGLLSRQSGEHGLRSLCLAYLDSELNEEDVLTIDIRSKLVEAVVVKYHLRSDAPPYAHPIVYGHEIPQLPIACPRPFCKGGGKQVEPASGVEGEPHIGPVQLVRKAVANFRWRQHECINLIPSEMTASPMVRLLSITDPAFRYAEHKGAKAFYDEEIFYYQGTDFIAEVEWLLEEEFRKYLGCREAETRVISGQMANMTVFSAMVDYINRADRHSEPRRIGSVMNNHIGKGGHLSAQPMGALRDFVARDPQTERPSVVNFPVMAENPYTIDLPAALELIESRRPEMIILGKSMMLHPEPVAQIKEHLLESGIDSVILYDAAHVLGLIGAYFQNPFAEGADLVTGSTHKSFFGTQRGIIAGCYEKHEERYELWEAVRRRTFPGAVSNHHLGTLVGLLMAAYEMNFFKDQYQQSVIANAKAFARALKDCGFDVAGDPSVDFTQTHQVIVNVGYARGPEVAKRLEDNNIICNYQATPADEGFSAASGIRMGVAEMTRFGMGEVDFQSLAALMKDIVIYGVKALDKVKALREPFRELRYCFAGDECEDIFQSLRGLV
ncbi:MAG: glycine cleavage system aminomethyltransferase GcvT [Syntrophobacteraceae bacterium]